MEWANLGRERSQKHTCWVLMTPTEMGEGETEACGRSGAQWDVPERPQASPTGRRVRRRCR